MSAPDETPLPPSSGQPPTPGGPVPGQQPYPPYPPYTQPPAYPPPGAQQVPPAYAAPPAHEVPPAYRPPAAHEVPPAYAPAPAYAQPYAQAPAAASPPRRGSGLAWLWWLVAIAIVLLIIASLVSIGSALSGNAGRGLGSSGNVVAVIPFDGTIAGTGGPAVITPESFLRLLERAENDPNVKAIVLRVDSPGGTVAASEEIATYVKQSTKPVVVSVGDVDASGAYMVSSQAKRIVAGPGSAVGSIGVIMEIPNVEGLMGKVGVSFKVLTAGKYKDAGSPFRPLTPVETAMLQGQIDQVYGQFIDIVASGRNLPRADVEKLATGWAWNGEEAKSLHLVDQIGTYKDALKTAAVLGGIKGQYREDVYNNADTLGSLLSSLLGIESQLKSIAANSPVNPASAGGTTLAK